MRACFWEMVPMWRQKNEQRSFSREAEIVPHSLSNASGPVSQSERTTGLV